MLTREQQREILAIGLLALAAFTLACLVPVSVLGERGGEWFPSGNAMGVVGGALRALLGAFFGVSAYLVPPLLVVAGLRAGEWMSPERALRMTVLNTGLLVLAPISAWVVTAEIDLSGWLGANLGGAMIAVGATWRAPPAGSLWTI